MGFRLQGNKFVFDDDPSQQVYNTLGRSNADKNFFERKASSIGNAVGTTLSAPISLAHDIGENIATTELLGRTKSNMNDVYKQFGFQGRDDYDRQLDAAEAAGDDAEVQRLLNLPGLQSALKKQANANAAEANAKAAGYDDYRKNNLISQNINQDRGKFLGSAINTLSTAYDVASMATGIPNGPITNAVQGGVEGIADELEENGLENFDWGRAGQNAAIGAATGAATGAFNNALGSRNLLGKGLTNKLAKSGVGRATLGLANGTVRGAASGAVGGATGAGLSSIMNNADFGTGLQNTIQGAVRGAGSGAMVGGTMAGINMGTNAALNKYAPQMAQKVQDASQEYQRWKDSGKDFNERLTNTLTSGKSAVGEWLQGNRQSNVLGAAGNIGNRIRNVSYSSDGKNTIAKWREIADPIYPDEKIVIDEQGNIGKVSNKGNASEAATAYEVRDSRLKPLDFSNDGDAEYYKNYLTKELGISGEEYDSMLVNNQTPTTAAGWLKKAGKRAVEDINKTNLGNRIQDVSDDEPQSLKQRALDAVNSLKGRQPAYAGGAANATVIKGGAPDGGDLVKADFVLPKNATKKTIAQAIKDVIGSKFQGKSYRIGNTDQEAKVNAKTRNEMSYQQPNMNDADFNRKGSMTGNLDELLENMRDASRVANKKPEAKPNVDYYISGRVPVDLGDGEVYYPRVDVEVSGGEPVAYNIADIKKYPGSTPQGVSFSGDQPAVDYQGTYGRKTIIPQGEQNVNPETEVYRTLTGQTEEPMRTSKEYEARQKRNQKLLDQYGTIDKPTAKATRAEETVGKIADAGFEKPQDVEAAIKKITGSDGEVNKLNRKVIANAGQINTWDGADNGTTLDDFIDQQVRINGLFGTSDEKAIKTELAAILNQLPSRKDGTLTGLDAAEDAFDVVQMIEKHSANYKGRSGSNYATSTPYKEQKAAVLDSVASLIKDRIYDASDVKKVVTPDVIADMKSWYPNNEKWARYVDENIASAKSGADLRAAQAPFVRMGKILDNTVVNSGTFGQKLPRTMLRMATSNPLGILVNGIELAGETNLGKRAQAKYYDWKANRAANKAANAGNENPTPAGGSTVPPAQIAETAGASQAYNPATQVYNAIGRNEGLSNGERARTAQYLNDVAQEAEVVPSADTVSTTAGNNQSTAVYNALTGVTTTNGAPMSLEEERQTYFFRPVGDEWADMLSRALRRASNAEDYEAMDELMAMYREAVSDAQSNSTSSTADLSATQQAQLAKLDAADSAIDELEGLFENAGGGKGPIAGGLQSIAGDWGLDTNARTYNQLSEGLVNQIAQAVGKTDSLNTEGEVKRALQLIPQLTDDAQTARNKLEALRRMLATTKSSYNAAYGITV